MKLRTLMLGIVCAAMLSTPAWADDPAKPKGTCGHDHVGKGSCGGAVMVDRQVERLNKELSLSQDQQDAIRKLIADHHDLMREELRKAMDENRDKIKDLHKQLKEARKAGDKEKVKTLEGQMRDLMGWGKKESSREKLMTDVAAKLTDEQKAKFEKVKGEVFACRPSLEDHPWLLWKAVESLELPKEKADKIKGIIDEWKTRAKETGQPEAKPEDLKAIKAEAAEVYKKVMAELTPEEQARVKEYQPGPTDCCEWGKGKYEGKGKGECKGHKHSGA